MKEHTTFIQIGKSRLIPIPFWAWLVIVRAKKAYWSIRIWVLRRLGIVYDFERGLTKRAADFACTCRVASETEMSTNPACPVHGEAAQSRKRKPLARHLAWSCYERKN